MKLKKRSHLQTGSLSVYLCFSIVMLLFAFIRFYPIIRIFFLSLFDKNMATQTQRFIGLGNYKVMFADKVFLTSLVRTVYIGLAVLLITLPLSLAIATALNRNIRFKSFIQSCLFLPYILPMVPMVIIWKWMMDYKYGIINYVLSFLSIAPIPWLTEQAAAELAIIIITVWKNIGYAVVMLSVGLAGIPKDYFEAAEIDGANSWKTFWNIILPQLSPVVVYVSVITLIRSFNVYTQAYVLASDSAYSSGHVVRVVVYDMMEKGFRFFKLGYASAEAVVLFLIIAVLTAIQMLLTNEDRRDRCRMKRVQRKIDKRNKEVSA